MILTLRPDWAHAVTETIKTPATVIESYDGTEQRAALATRPLRSLSYTARTMTAEETASAEAVLYSAAAPIFQVPHWPQVRLLAESAASGSTRLQLNAAFSTAPIARVAARLSEGQYIAIAVQSASTSTLQLAEPLTQALHAGTPIYPTLFGRVESELVSLRDAASAEYNISIYEEL